jgi:hypothetical protein
MPENEHEQGGKNSRMCFMSGEDTEHVDSDRLTPQSVLTTL